MASRPLAKAERAERKPDLTLIRRIAQRAVLLYDSHNVVVDEVDVVIDLASCHFGKCKLRLEELLAARDFDLMHDVGGINKHLNRDTEELSDGFSPRFRDRGIR